MQTVINENMRFFINKDKKIVTAVKSFRGQWVRGFARCHPEDEFDLELGKSLAAARCNLKMDYKRLEFAEKQLLEASDLLSQAADDFKEANTDVLTAKMVCKNTERKLKTILKTVQK